MVLTATKKDLKVDISSDKVKAYLVFPSGFDFSALGQFDVFNLLSGAKIRNTDYEKGRVEHLINLIRGGQAPAEPFLISQGTPAVEPCEPRFIWNEKINPVRPVDQVDSVNFYQQHKLITVESGDIIGTIDLGQPGKEGLDVFGVPIKTQYRPTAIKIGENVVLEPDGKTVKASVSGQVFFLKNKIFVRPVLEISGDVDFKTGNVEAASDILIHGSVRDLFIVKSKHNISVRGMAEACYLFSEGDITIVGGVKGREKSLIEAKGNVQAKFLNSVYLEAGGDVEIGKESIDSLIISNGKLKLAGATIISGHAFGVMGGEIKSLGSPSGVKTVVGIGFNPISYKHIFEIDAKIKANKALVEKIKTSIQPLLAQMKRLSPEQREKATELMYKAQSMEVEIQEMEARKKSIFDSFPIWTEIALSVTSAILPNTTIFIGDRFLNIREEIRGPIKLVMRKTEGAKEIFVVNQSSGSIRTMICGKFDVDAFDLPVKPQIAQPGIKS